MREEFPAEDGVVALVSEVEELTDLERLGGKRWGGPCGLGVLAKARLSRAYVRHVDLRHGGLTSQGQPPAA